MKKLILFLTLIVLIILAACSSSNVKIGFVGTDQDGLIDYQFVSFSGHEKQAIVLEEGDNLVINYEIDIEKGSLEITLLDIDKNPIKTIFTDECISDRIEFNCEESGRYILDVKGNKAKGSFKITW